MATERIPLTMGAGIDRGSGVTVASPSRGSEIKNVHLHPGRTEYRRGLARIMSDAGADAILAMEAIEQTGQVAIVMLAGQYADLVIADVRPNGDFSPARYFPRIMLLDRAGIRPPIVVMEAAYDKLLIAHAEPNIGRRANTLVFDVGSDLPPQPVLIFPPGND